MDEEVTDVARIVVAIHNVPAEGDVGAVLVGYCNKSNPNSSIYACMVYDCHNNNHKYGLVSSSGMFVVLTLCNLRW